jgi:hypothetical protein
MAEPGCENPEARIVLSEEITISMGWIKASIDETCHVAWRVRLGETDTYLHAIGEGESGNCVTENLAKVRTI